MSMVTPGGHGLGLIRDTPDHRDRLYTPAPEHTAYQFVDLEPDPATPPVWDQGQLGSCTAHGTLACFLWASAKCGADDPMLSRLMQYWLTRNLEGTTDSDSGGQIRDAIKATTLGVAPETLWPYDITQFTVKPSDAAFAAAPSNVDLDYQRVDVSTDAIQACLTEGFPVDIGVSLDPTSFESQDALTSGIIPVPDNPQDGHCMAIWGIGTGADWKTHNQFPAADDTTLYGKVRNSWGTGVYQRGYLLMPMTTYLADPDLGSDYWTIRRVS